MAALEQKEKKIRNPSVWDTHFTSLMANGNKVFFNPTAVYRAMVTKAQTPEEFRSAQYTRKKMTRQFREHKKELTTELENQLMECQGFDLDDEGQLVQTVPPWQYVMKLFDRFLP